jgi:predicted acyltransferase
MGTLQRIGLCYLVAAWIALYTRSTTQWVTIVALLLGYAILLHWTGSYTPFTNMSDRIDNLILGIHAVITDPVSGAHRDPDGLLSTLGALTTTLLGIRAGDWLRDNKTRHLCIAGLTLMVAGYAWSYGMPINKKMWTGPFVLWTGGWAMLGLGLYHELIDRQHWPAIGRTLGVNAITAYIGSLLVFFALYRFGWWHPIYQRVFASWLTPLSSPYLTSLCYAVTFTSVAWLILKGLDQRGWRLRF